MFVRGHARGRQVTALIAALLAGACNPSPATPGPTAPPVTSAAPTSPASIPPTPGPTPASTAGATPALTPSPPPATTPLPGGPPAIGLELVAAIPRPLAVTHAGDGSGRLFVAGQDGRIWVIEGGRRAAEPLLDIADRITTGGERGLLGVAFHPRFPTDARLFVDYTDRSGNTVIASYSVTAGEPMRANPSTEQVILRVNQPFANHNGGAVVFGPDGFLYIGLGDGGGGGDPQDNGQRLDTHLGKILRIDVDGDDGTRAYRVPADNPFVGRAGARPEIWHYGLRNPYRFTFDRATGDIWIGDVGQNAREEVSVARAGSKGLNFGWARTEGLACFPASQSCSTSGLTLPVADYRHDQGCSVVGGYVYRGQAFPALAGWYVFADYCSGLVFVIRPDGDGQRAPTVVATTPMGVSSFGEDEAGELYLANVVAGSVSRLVPAS